MAKEQDERVGRWVIEKGLITARQLQECLQELDSRYRSKTAASTTSLSLANLLLEKGFVHPADLKVAGAPAAPVAEQGLDGAPDLPEEVRQARRFKDSRYGKYTILKLIATGGMGAVYRAWDNDLNRIVAIKFLTDSTEESINRFIREAQTAARLSHPHIAQIYDVGKVDNRHYIAMEYIEGITLDNLPESARSVEIPKILRIMSDVAFAVDYAHSRGIVHRDLKPQNVIIDNAAIPHIMDFGLARMVAIDGMDGPANNQRREVTASGTIVGTPNYLSPEQARGDLSLVGPHSDIYSLGATLYALLTGVPPFIGETGMDVVLMVLQQEPVAPRTLNPHIPRDVETIILRALQKDPGARYSSARGFGDDLHRFLNEEPILARRPGPVAQVMAYARRHPLALMGVVTLTMLLIFTPVTFWLIDRNEQRLKELQDKFNREQDAQRQAEVRRVQAEGFIDEARRHVDRLEFIYRLPAASLKEIDSLSAQGLANLGKALSADPESVQALSLRARLYATIDRPDLATADLDALVAKAPGRRDLVLERGRLHLAAGVSMITSYTLPPTIQIGPLKLPAPTLARFELAEKDLDVVSTDPTMTLPWVSGCLEFAKSNWLGAIAILEALAPTDGDCAYLLAHAYLRIGKPAEAAVAAKQAMGLRPHFPTATFVHIASLLRSSNIEAAVTALKAIPASSAEDHRLSVLRGHTLLIQGQTAEAVLVYSSGLSKRPRDPVLLISRAKSFGPEEAHRAMADLTEAVNGSPELAPVALTIRAGLRASLDDALNDCDEAVKANNLYPDAFRVRAVIREKKGDLKGAEEDRLELEFLERQLDSPPRR